MCFMSKLVNFILVIVALAALGYVAFCVPLGEKTFYEHMVGISKTDEAKKLEGEIEKKVKNAADDLTDKLKKQAADLAEAKREALLKGDDKKEDGDSEKVEAEHSNEDKKDLGELIHQAAEPDAADKQALDKLIKDKSSKTD